jgi:uncharacterized membrane protein (DUF373 family)
MLAAGLQEAEHALNVGIALALAVAGVGLFVYVVVSFVSHVGDDRFVDSILHLLDGLILVFIVTELLHTLRSVIAEGVLLTEPFLIVGIVAIVRRLIVISAEASGFVGKSDFDDLMVEMAVLVGGLLVLGLVIFLLRRSGRDEPAEKGTA